MNAEPQPTRQIALYGGDYEHVLELARKVRGIDITYYTAPPADIFLRMISERAYEACEFSLSNYLILKDRGADWLTPIPVFPYRAFRHSTLYVRKNSDYRTPQALAGKTVGVPDYSMTAAVWTRGILLEEYGVHWSTLEWVTSGPQRFETLGQLPVRASDDDLEQALIDGSIDALLTTRLRDNLKPESERLLRTLIPDAESVERAYFTRTGIFPINHLVAIRNDTLQRVPDAKSALFDAYTIAKNSAYRRRLGTTLLPWSERTWTATTSFLGGDPLPYGDTPSNRSIVESVARFLFEQQLVSKLPDTKEIFESNESYR